MASKKAYVFLAEGFEVTEALATVDVLRRARLDVTTVSISHSLEVMSSNRILVKADRLFSESSLSDGDAIVLPGGMPGTLNLEHFEPLIDLILEYHRTGKLIGAICAAPSILGHLNLLKDEEAIAYPGFENDLYGATVSDNSVVRSHQFITARGMGVSHKFALKIVETLLDEETATQVAATAIIE